MKQFREDGARLCVIENQNPNAPDVQMWCKNHKNCVFCEHCKKEIVPTPGGMRIKTECQLPSVSTKGNCLMYMLNDKQQCQNFKDVDGDTEGVFMIKRQPLPTKEQIKEKAATFSISKDEVKQTKK